MILTTSYSLTHSMQNTATSPATSLPWEAFHDRECEQWQVIDQGETRVIATGIEGENDARFIVRACNAHEDLRLASQELYDRLQEYLDVSDDELIEQGHEGLVEAMDAMEVAWHKADGTGAEQDPGEAA